MELKPGMRVLDLGCGRAISSIFLAREYAVDVWATDLWIAASENLLRIRDAGLLNQVFPDSRRCRALPYAGDYFDAIVSIDAYPYFGTDDLYLNYLTHFVKPGGQIGIVGAGLIQEVESGVPEHLREFWTQDIWALQFCTLVEATLGTDRHCPGSRSPKQCPTGGGPGWTGNWPPTPRIKPRSRL